MPKLSKINLVRYLERSNCKFYVFMILCFFSMCTMIMKTDLIFKNVETSFENSPDKYKCIGLILKRLESLDQHKTEVRSITNDNLESPNSSVSQNVSGAHQPTERGNRTLMKDLYVEGFSIPNAHFCPEAGKNLKVLVAVLTSTDHADRRQAIRQTYGLFARSQQNGVRIAFVVAAPAHPATNDAILREHNRHGDLIQGRFQDTYRNLSLKTVNLLEWVHLYCPKVPFVLKTDDDMFVDVTRLLEVLEQFQQAKRSLIGQLWTNHPVGRDANDPKYYTSREELEADVFPDFLIGWGYLMTGDVVKELYEAALPATFMHSEDVLISGILAPTLGIRIINMREFCCKSREDCLKSEAAILMCKSIEKFFILWKWLYGRRRSVLDGLQ